MIKRMVIMLILVAAVVSGIVFVKYQGFKGFEAMKAGMAQAKQTVSSTKATLEPWQTTEEAVGSLRADKGVDISNELAGIVEELKFTSGGDVKAGTLLVKLRAEDDIAKLHSLEAAAKIADITYKRDKKQLKVQAISQATFDNDAATLSGAKALVDEQKAVVDKKFIKAPFSGHLGIRNVDLGQYLNPGTAIVTLQELDPIYLDFYLPEQSLAYIKTGQRITAKSDVYPSRKFDGSIAAINPKVDTATRNIQIRAAFKNRDHALLPGMYVTARIVVGKPVDYVTLPQTAISYNPYGDTVFIVKENGKNQKGEPKLTAEQSFVTVGEKRGDQVQILKGVKEGDEVVSAGQIKLQNGAAIVINNTITPKNDANPDVKDQ